MTIKISPRLFWMTSTFGIAAQLIGCGTSTPLLDSKFGDAVRVARQQQTLNPSAPTGNNSVLGIDGQAASSALDRYHESFKAPPQTFEILNIGGALSGGGR